MNQQNIWELKGSQLIKQIRRAEVVKQMLKHSKAKQILDIGCAEGFITNYLSQLQAQVIGIDIDQSLKIAKNKVKKRGFHSSIHNTSPLQRWIVWSSNPLRNFGTFAKCGRKQRDSRSQQSIKIRRNPNSKCALQGENYVYPLHTLWKAYATMGARSKLRRKQTEKLLPR
jgi:SAM-dependent methyltransferase